MAKRKIEFEIQEDAIVFKAVLDRHGVQTIPDWMDDKANEVAAKHGREIMDVEGNFEEVRFCVNRAFTEKELEESM